MTSLDDIVISDRNLRLLDNVTNYSKPAVDYFSHDFNSDDLEIALSWGLLSKMKKQKILRLPSCSSEDDTDYYIYQVRLHHCLWRRWSIDFYKLNAQKYNPLAINWNKEIDVTVLYGPDLTTVIDELYISANEEDDDDDNTETNSLYHDDLAYTSKRASTPDSLPNSFDTLTSGKSLKFSSNVLRRDIDAAGTYHETQTIINDIVDYPLIYDDFDYDSDMHAGLFFEDDEQDLLLQKINSPPHYVY